MKSQETLVGLPKYVAGKGNPDGFNLDLRKLGWFHLGISGNPGRCRSGFQWSLQILMLKSAAAPSFKPCLAWPRVLHIVLRPLTGQCILA